MRALSKWGVVAFSLAQPTHTHARQPQWWVPRQAAPGALGECLGDCGWGCESRLETAL